MLKKRKKNDGRKLREQSRRLRDIMAWLVRGFTLYDPRKSYPGFYLSPQQSYVLTVVKEAREINPGIVAKKLRLEKSHLTKIVNSLIGMGAIEKLTDEDDRRRLVLMLTEKGKKIYRELDKASVDSYIDLMKYVSSDEREGVIHAMEILEGAMEELRKEQG